MMPRPAARTRPGFTMVELLVVIAIIAILAALTVAAVTRVQEKSRELKVRHDFSSLETSISALRGKNGNAPIPCYGSGPNGTFQLCTQYTDSSGNFLGGFTAGSPEIVILKRMFNRINLFDNGLRVQPANTNTLVAGQTGASGPAMLDPNQLLVFFLSGGSFTNYTGFATDPAQPFKISGARLNGTPYFEFPKARMVKPIDYRNEEISVYQGQRFTTPQADDSLGNQEPWFLDPWGNPYLYFSANNGNDYPFDTSFTNSVTAIQTQMQMGLQIGPWGGPYSVFGLNGNTSTTEGPRPVRESPTFTAGASVPPATTTPFKFRNPKTVQILSAGRDGIWGRGQQKNGYALFPGVLADPTNYPENGYTGNQAPFAYSNSVPGGGDDYANFTGNKLGTPE